MDLTIKLMVKPLTDKAGTTTWCWRLQGAMAPIPGGGPVLGPLPIGAIRQGARGGSSRPAATFRSSSEIASVGHTVRVNQGPLFLSSPGTGPPRFSRTLGAKLRVKRGRNVCLSRVHCAERRCQILH